MPDGTSPAPTEPDLSFKRSSTTGLIDLFGYVQTGSDIFFHVPSLGSFTFRDVTTGASLGVVPAVRQDNYYLGGPFYGLPRIAGEHALTAASGDFDNDGYGDVIMPALNTNYALYIDKTGQDRIKLRSRRRRQQTQ